jgi:hypothetical protein
MSLERTSVSLPEGTGISTGLASKAERLTLALVAELST